MTFIQIILIALVVAIGLLYFFSLRSRLISRMTALALIATGVLFVLHPDLTNQIAHFLGVGRGTDLLFYLFSLAVSYGFLLLYIRIRALDRKVTDLARTIALELAKEPADNA